MHRRHVLAVSVSLLFAGCVDRSPVGADTVTRSAIDPEEPTDGETLSSVAHFAWAIEDAADLDVVQLEEHRVSRFNDDLWLTYRTDHPTEVPEEAPTEGVDPEPGEFVFFFEDETGLPDAVEAEIVAITLLYATLIEDGGSRGDLHAVVVDGFDDPLYEYDIKHEWIDRFVDGPAQFVEVQERVLETIEIRQQS
ncbi:hypothetical protein ACYJ1Y_16085 [Natrialbaceae archaeon A-gly3]